MRACRQYTLIAGLAATLAIDNVVLIFMYLLDVSVQQQQQQQWINITTIRLILSRVDSHSFQ
jgi:competence protein ComGF